MGASASRVISVAGSAASRLNRYEYRTAVRTRTLPVSVPSASGLQCTTRPGTRTTCSEGAHGVFVCAVAESAGLVAARPASSSRKTSTRVPSRAVQVSRVSGGRNAEYDSTYSRTRVYTRKWGAPALTPLSQTPKINPFRTLRRRREG